MTAPLPIKALIVDDEPPARRTLRLLLEREPDVIVAGEAGDGAGAVALARSIAPDVMFLDVQMPGGGGFDVLRALGAGRRPMIVFVTAFDRYAVQAFDAHALDYLLKPFSDERFAVVLDRVREAVRRESLAALESRVEALLKSVADARPPSLLVRDGARTLVLPQREIEWIEAEDYYVRIHAGRRQPLVRHSLRALATELDPGVFVRAHRSAIINLDHVREIRSLPSGDQEATMASGTVVRLSRSFRDDVAAAIARRTSSPAGH
jgi:two-component system LytT family response regulator